jgi:toxin-antitoxin system PIN domain toxin
LADINVWLALSFGSHVHSVPAWEWFDSLRDDTVYFCRFTQLGLLRLQTTSGVMGPDCLTVQEAWRIYDNWLLDPHVAFCNEPAEVDTLFRLATAHVSRQSSPKALGDSYLLGMSQAAHARLVTFDGGLARLAAKMRHDVLLLA